MHQRVAGDPVPPTESLGIPEPEQWCRQSDFVLPRNDRITRGAQVWWPPERINNARGTWPYLNVKHPGARALRTISPIGRRAPSTPVYEAAEHGERDGSETFTLFVFSALPRFPVLSHAMSTKHHVQAH